MTKEQVRKKEWYEANKERINRERKELYEQNKDNINAERRRLYNENRDSLLEKRRVYEIENKEHIEKRVKKYHITNRKRILAKKKEYRENNKSKIREDKKVWDTNNREHINNYVRKKVKTDPVFRMSVAARGLICHAIRRFGYTKKSKTYKILGCSFDEFKLHIESQLEDWMNWDNYGKYNGEYGYGWDIDHIVPISSANSEDDVIALNHYANLQPLCSKINRVDKKDLLL